MQLLLVLSIIIIALLNFCGLYFEWYITVRWMDIPMHIAGGAWLALAFWYVAHDRLKALTFEKKWVVFFAGLGVVAITGIVWEFWEFFLAVYVRQQYALLNAPGDVHFDTLHDLFNDLVGGAIALWVLVVRSGKKLPSV